MTRISACLIVKDEEKHLARCLASLAGRVDELIVVDTGSSDRTPEIARQHGAHVFSFDWCDDFSAARNESLMHASGDWVLWIDADDELIEREPGALRQACEQLAGEAWGYFTEVHCEAAETGQAPAVVRQWRIFPNRRGIHFEGRIHEHLAAARVIHQEDIKLLDALYVQHWGYAASAEDLRRKSERNRRLAELAIRDDPRQPRNYFNLGLQMASDERHEEALATLEEGISRWFTAHGADVGYVPAMFATAASSANALSRFEQTLRIEARTPTQFISSDLLYHAGLACWRLGRAEDAIERLNRAWQDQAAAANNLWDRSTSSWRPQALLKEIYEALGRSPSVSITACMIVRNEERNIDRCLGSLDGVVDEVIIVDTGSTDRTAEIANQHGAKVSHFEWCDDFSAARNESLSKATSDWIVWVDADEELVETTPGALRGLCQRLPAPQWGYFAEQRSPTGPHSQMPVVVRQWRIFPNRQSIRFEGRVHENPAAPTAVHEDQLLTQDQVYIQHWGYLPDDEVMSAKHERNRRLSELALAESPDEPVHHFNLAKEWASTGDFDTALSEVEQAIALWSAQGRAHSTVVGAMFTLAAGCALNLGRYDQVLELEAQVPRSSMSADVIYSSGIACWLLGRTNEAIERLQRAHDDPSVRQALDNDPARCTWQPLVALSKIYAQLGQDEKSSEYARRALAYKPGDREMEDMLSALTAKMAKREEPVRISACMIVKNEEQGLERCLQSLQGAIDEIVLVDTGSTDKTVAIAEKHGAKVFHFTWCDDFAAARNEAIKQATGNWIIIVDGDDELIESSPGALRRLCASHVGFGYLLNCHSEVEGRQVIGQQWRIAPKLPGLGYKGRIHEQLQPPPGVPCELVLQNDVAIRHWGYTTDRANLEEKHRRNVKLLELTLAEEPNEPFHHYNLAREYGWEQDYGKGLRYAEQALRLWHEQGQPQSLYVGPMFTVAVTMAFNNGQYQRALELDAMTPSGNVSADLLFCAGMACWQLGRHADAVARLERARRDRSLVVSSDADPSLATWQPALALSKIYAELNQADKAYEWASDAAALMPERPDIVLGWAQTAASCGHPDEAISAARSLIGGDADAAYQAQARRLLLDIGDQTNNVALILEALSGEAAGVSEPDAALIRAVAYERLGDLQAQRETLDTASQRFPDDARILLAFARLAASPSVGAGS